ncbi:MAG: hypothetical protein H7Z39_11870 [Burkholderiaceae bacterium]|nr:hypothetical protein [Burkholderiaceae bacterium]
MGRPGIFAADEPKSDRLLVEANGCGNYQTLINDALVAHIQQQSMLDAVRQVVREELAAR